MNKYNLGVVLSFVFGFTLNHAHADQSFLEGDYFLDECRGAEVYKKGKQLAMLSFYNFNINKGCGQLNTPIFVYDLSFDSVATGVGSSTPDAYKRGGNFKFKLVYDNGNFMGIQFSDGDDRHLHGEGFLKKVNPDGLFSSAAQNGFCTQYVGQSKYMTAIHSVATAMGYTDPQLCSLSTLVDIQLMPSIRYNEENLRVDHVLVTLYYETYACQYWVRNDDQVITSKNCYNTW